MASPSTFDELLKVFWLRPETALWRELDIRAMQSFAFRSPSLDLGCGDGLFSFVRAGGRFDDTFDAFRDVAHLDRFFDNVDVFDAPGESAPVITRRPDHRIDCGFDQKHNLLRKAARLDFYRELKQGDANSVLPFFDASFNSVFSNIVYWLDDPQAVITEIARIVCPGGQVCLMLPNRTLPEFSFYNQLYKKTGNSDWRFLEKLDRGRFTDNIRHARSAEEWEQMFTVAGLHVAIHNNHLSKTVIQIWDVGFRPLFPVLRRMADTMHDDILSDIRREWEDTLREFLLPIVNMDSILNQGTEPAFHCYILEK